MIKIAIFTEGQSELIFVRELLLKIFNWTGMTLQCMTLRAGRMHDVPYQYSLPNPKVHFFILNVGNDEKVLSAVKEYEDGLIARGYQKIIGLRDLYSLEYRKRSRGNIRQEVSDLFINSFNATLRSMNNAHRIALYLAIMELEAWFLGMYNLFRKINGLLTTEFIEERCGYNLQNIDPQTQFFKPSNQLEQIFALGGHAYRKKESDIEMMTACLDIGDCENAIENGRCTSFERFYAELMSYRD